MRVTQQQREERRRTAGEAGRGAGFDVDQHGVLIGRRQLGERRTARRSCVSIERRQS
jgi:hypothetical protein